MSGPFFYFSVVLFVWFCMMNTMEQFPYSKERAEEEASRIQKLIQHNHASSYKEAEALAELTKRETRPDGSYKEDFGHILERMMQQVLREIPGVSEVFTSSEYDDKRAVGEKIDIIVCLNDGGKVALQVTASDNDATREAKFRQLLRNPVLQELHNDKGSVILKELIPRGIASAKRAVWGGAYDASLKQGVSFQGSLLPNARLEKIGLLERIIFSMEAAKMSAKKHQPSHEALFNDRIHALQQSITTLRTM